MVTGLESFNDVKISDLFAGTGVVSYHFRNCGATVLSNDAELYIFLTHAFTCSTFTATCEKVLEDLQQELDQNKHADSLGFVTTHYSPHLSCERKFFTIENAKRID